jgi:DICT domain-containing protein
VVDVEPDLRPSLTIGELALRTGVPTTTLRSWEKRYGFPRPLRQAGGHRRYAESDVAAVRAVLDGRRAGLSLTAAVEHADAPRHTGSGSVFAELRRRHPAPTPQVLSRRTLAAMSRAIEDECCARAARPLLFGGFQRERFLRPALGRWRDLARTARRTVVFADFADPAPPDPDGFVEVGLPPDSPLHREWLLICDAEDLPACLVAVEQPGQDGGAPGSRLFEAMWSVDPQVVRDASRVAAALADLHGPGWRSGEPHEGPPAATASTDLHRASQLFDRMLHHLDART